MCLQTGTSFVTFMRSDYIVIQVDYHIVPIATAIQSSLGTKGWHCSLEGYAVNFLSAGGRVSIWYSLGRRGRLVCDSRPTATGFWWCWKFTIAESPADFLSKARRRCLKLRKEHRLIKSLMIGWRRTREKIHGEKIAICRTLGSNFCC